MPLHRSSFVKALRQEFPAIEPWLAGYRDNLTFEMMRFRHFTEDAIARGDLATVRKCFAFLRRAFETGNHHVRGSVVASYLEHLDFVGANGAAAEKLLPSELAAVRTEMLAWFRKLDELPKKRRRRNGAA
jgi:hypothetical protein